MTSEIFKKELELIEDESIRNFTTTILENAPQSYFIREASSTNKYHPPSSRGYQGLSRHVKRCVYIAEQLLRNDIYAKLRPQHDIIIAALILHDCKKYGDNNSKWSLKNHAELAAYWIADFEYEGIIDIDIKKQIAQLVLTHMGQWGSVVPSNSLEKFVHLCDYIASLKELESEVADMPVEDMAKDAKAIADNPAYYQLNLFEQEKNEQINEALINADEKMKLLNSTTDPYLKDILS